jgi:hypothetical protein
MFCDQCSRCICCCRYFTEIGSFIYYSVFTHTNPSFFDGSATHATADLIQTTEAFDGAVNNHQNETSLAHQFEGRVPECAENNHATNKMLHFSTMNRMRMMLPLPGKYKTVSVLTTTTKQQTMM